jgi:MFS family permease
VEGVVTSRVEWRLRLLVPVLVSIGMVVAVVSSLGSPMVPTVAAEYGVSLGTAQWTLTIALLAGATVTPVLGRLGDGMYRREVILTSLGVISLGAVLAVIPAGFGLLLVGRGLQGVGIGLMPLAMSVARDHLPSERAGSAVAVLSITTAAGVGIGYPLSGLCAETVGFHATFLLAAAMAGVAWLGAFVTIPSSRHRPRQPIDLVGAVGVAVGVAALVIALSEMSSWGATSGSFVLLLLVSAVALTGWVFHERRVAAPLVDLRTLRNPSVRVAQTVAMLAGVGMYMLLSLVIRYVQTPTSTGYGQGRSVLVAGLILVPFSVASLATNRLLPALRRRVGVRSPMPLGCVAFIVAMALFASARSSLWEVLLVMVLAGIGVGIVFASMPILIVSVVPASETGSALGFNQVLRTIGGSVGSAASAAALSAHTSSASPFPLDGGYTEAAMIGIAVLVLATVVAWPRRSLSVSGATAMGSPEELVAESVDAEVAGVIMYEMDADPDDVGR